jgi:predicted DNA-binding transcriptional regulator AlpA
MSNDLIPLPTAPIVFTIREFCARNKISKSTFYKLKERGLAPREMELGRAIRISAKAEADWQAARDNPHGEEARRNARDAKARVVQAKKAGKLSVASARHVSKGKRN